MGEGQADERPTRLRVRVRRALTGEVRQEEQPVAAGRDRRGRAGQLVEGDAGREGVPEPAQAARRREHHGHQVPAPRDGVAERVHAAVRLEERVVGGREHDPRRPQRQRHDRLRRPPRRRRRLRPGRRRRRPPGSRAAARLPRPRGVHDPGDRGALVGWREPRRVDPQLDHDLGRPIARREVEQQRPGPVGLVDRVVPRQPEPDEVLGQEQVSDPRPGLGLVLTDPERAWAR